MRRVVWSGEALEELEDAMEFVGTESVSARHKLVERIKSALVALAEMPIGRQGRVKGSYEWYVKRTGYIVAYSLDETSLHVLHLIHGARDWPEDAWPSGDA